MKKCIACNKKLDECGIVWGDDDYCEKCFRHNASFDNELFAWLYGGESKEKSPLRFGKTLLYRWSYINNGEVL